MLYAANEMILGFHPETLNQSLLITLKGMVGIFAVILVIWAFVAVLNRATSKKKAD